MDLRPSRGWGPDTAPGRVGLFWISIWTLFLLQPLATGWQERDRWTGWVGMVLVVAFAVVYVGTFGYQRRRMHAGTFALPTRQGLAVFALLVALAVAQCALLGQSGTASAVYLCVLSVMILDHALRWWLVALTLAVTYAAGILVPGWERDTSLLLAMLAASVAVYGVQHMIAGNVRLRLADDQNQRLAVADERNRFARDLHDILGHSLTVIRVKAELAGRLVDADPPRARAELEDLERLAREALGDVRRAVEGYRELTLPGELTRARAALRAAEIEADLPNSTDEIPGDLRELFAWTVREGVTNVVRHSGARRCVVRLSPTSAEVRDDGRGLAGETAGDGNGLLGLRERASALGATVVCRPGEPKGHTLQVLVGTP
ncbi:sensor histidine kinase [Marmoricola endophyticus]|uniref:sensor histidine kinase n=1 Tax=Marmoricola endophyticus TaxID=2040280 RepID=UPI001E2E94D1|nr:sensor histidine kinase [Marmoricola endophyticus]